MVFFLAGITYVSSIDHVFSFKYSRWDCIFTNNAHRTWKWMNTTFSDFVNQIKY